MKINQCDENLTDKIYLIRHFSICCVTNIQPFVEGFLKKEMGLEGKVLDVKLTKKSLDKRECEELEMALQHKSKLHIYRELKWQFGFEKYLEYVKGTLLDCFNILFGYPWAVEELHRHANNRGGPQECPNCGACKELVEHVLVEYASYNSQRQSLWTT